VMKRIWACDLLALLAAILLIPPSLAFDYINGNIGQKMIFKGVITANNEKSEFSYEVSVLNPGIVEGAKFDVVHYSFMKGANFQQEKILFYLVKAEGIFLAATADKWGGEVTVLKQPSLEYPLPLTQGAKWHRSRIEGGKKVELDMEVISIDQQVKIGEKEETVAFIKGTGTSESNGETAKMEKQIWLSKVDRVRQITTIENASGTSTSEVTFDKQVSALADQEPAPTVSAKASEVSPAAQQEPKDAHESK
jgi:hypothetical protein